MTDLKKEELSGWLKHQRFSRWNQWKWTDKDQQAYQQIKTCIGEAFTIPDTSKREAELEGIIIKMQEELDKKPQVTEGWIEEKAVYTANDYPDVAFPNLITIFKELLKEAGVGVSG